MSGDRNMAISQTYSVEDLLPSTVTYSSLQDNQNQKINLE
jgi:hypothetical protein